MAVPDPYAEEGASLATLPGWRRFLARLNWRSPLNDYLPSQGSTHPQKLSARNAVKATLLLLLGYWRIRLLWPGRSISVDCGASHSRFPGWCGTGICAYGELSTTLCRKGNRAKRNKRRDLQPAWVVSHDKDQRGNTASASMTNTASALFGRMQLCPASAPPAAPPAARGMPAFLPSAARNTPSRRWFAGF